jgi:hypothetical protein
VARSSPRTDVWNANAVLLVAGAAAIVVATVGLFSRSSPTLSGTFLVVGAALLIVAVFEAGRNGTGNDSTGPEIDLALLERSARAAESEIARGELHSLVDVNGGYGTTAVTDAFVANPAVDTLRHADEETAGALTQELHALPMLEETSRMAPIEGFATGYKSVTLPSGYMAVYRRLTPVEIKEATGTYPERDAYVVANLVPLIPSHDER